MKHVLAPLTSILALGILAVGVASPSFVQTACEDTRVTASDSGVFESFGYAVGVWADTALIGAQWDRELGTEAGAAYIFELDRQGQAWVESQKLMASDGAAGNHFGRAAAIDGDTAMITATSHLHDGAGGNGSVYVFDYNGTAWTEQQELIASDGAIGDVFGRSVSISDDVALIGAPGHDDIGTNSGSAYVFRFDPDTSRWVEEQKLLASDGDVSDTFGFPVAISGDTAVIGAPGSDDACPDRITCNSGAAYIFDLAACLCPADLDGDGSVNILDLLALLAAWGTDPGGPPDFDGATATSTSSTC